MINKENVTVTDTIEKTVSVTCDICKKTYSLDKQSNDIFEVQEFIHVKEHCGYGSIFGDGDVIELDMCQHCFKEKLGQYIRITQEY